MGRLKQYDLTIDGTISGATTPFGLMLVKDGKKGIQYIDQRASVLNPNLSPDSINYAAYPPDKDWPIAQTSFNAGFGKLIANSNYNNRYGESLGWDLREDGNAQLFGAETAVTVNTKAALSTSDYSNMGFETWTDLYTLDDWTASSGLLTRRSTDADAGSYAANLLFGITDDFSTDNFTDVGTKIVVDATTDYRIEFEAERSAVDNRTYYDLTAISDTEWLIEFDLYITTNAGANALFGVGLFSAAENINGMAGDGIYMYFQGSGPSLDIRSVNGGVADADSTDITVATGTTYYVSLERVSATSAKISIFSDALRTTHISGSPQTATIAAGVDTLRYFQVSNVDDNNGAAIEAIGWIDNLFISGQTPSAQTLTQSLSTWASYYNNKAATATVKAKTSLANNLRIRINDGVTTSESSYHTGGGSYETLTVNHTPVVNATKLDIVIMRDSTTFDSGDIVDVVTFTQATISRGTPLKFMHWGSSEYYLENKTIFKWDGSDSYDEYYTVEDAIVDGIIYENRFVISVGTGDFYYYSDAGDDDVWTRAAGATQKFGVMQVVKGVLWAAVASAAVANTTDITGAASTGSSVGDGNVTITGLSEDNGTLYVHKEDNIYVLTIDWDALTYTTEPIAPRFKAIASTDNFRVDGVADTHLFCHSQGVLSYEYTDYGYSENISPSIYGPSFTDYHGAARAIAVGENWAYIITDAMTGNTKSKVMAVRREYIADADKQVDWRWHALGEVDLDEVYCADRHSDKLWVAGTKSSTPGIKSFTVRGTKVYPNCGGSGVAVHYQIDDDSSWTSLGTFDDASGTETIAFPAGKHGYLIRFRVSVASAAYYFTTSYYGSGLPGELKSFRTVTLIGETLTATGTSQTPIVRRIVLRSVLRTPPLRTIWCKVKCHDEMITKDGGDKVLASVLKGYLDACVVETDPFTLYDIHGNSLTCVLVPPTPYESNITQDLIHDRVMSEIELLFQEVKTS